MDAPVLEGSDVDLVKAELAENLDRAELTRFQRDRELDRYVGLREQEVLSHAGGNPRTIDLRV
jgi:hypothetical protein